MEALGHQRPLVDVSASTGHPPDPALGPFLVEGDDVDGLAEDRRRRGAAGCIWWPPRAGPSGPGAERVEDVPHGGVVRLRATRRGCPVRDVRLSAIYMSQRSGPDAVLPDRFAPSARFTRGVRVHDVVDLSRTAAGRADRWPSSTLGLPVCVAQLAEQALLCLTAGGLVVLGQLQCGRLDAASAEAMSRLSRNGGSSF